MGVVIGVCLHTLETIHRISVIISHKSTRTLAKFDDRKSRMVFSSTHGIEFVGSKGLFVCYVFPDS